MSPFTRFYYVVKPLLPWRLRLGIRRWFALRKRPRVSATWPILPGSERPPVGWLGWPDGKDFALVLTHDVESQKGLDRVKHLAELEMSLGFRSSFNFIPDGEYQVPAELRSWLTSNGFEVGVHDHRHDGKLYSSHERFQASTREINRRLKEWGAVGFRSGFMLRNLEWLHGLDIAYDASTFDTDPFEPQPDGVGTIFPFWVPRQSSSSSDSTFPLSAFRFPLSGTSSSSDSASPLSAFSSPLLEAGYLELPYTLPQDFTLFLLLKEPTNELWKRKLTWIASQGGMALMNVHPDYMAFDGTVPTGEYSADLYREFLVWVTATFDDQFARILPRSVAAHFRKAAPGLKTTSPTKGPRLSSREFSAPVCLGF